MFASDCLYLLCRVSTFSLSKHRWGREWLAGSHSVLQEKEIGRRTKEGRREGEEGKSKRGKWWRCVCGYMADWFISRAPLGSTVILSGHCPRKGRERWEDLFWEREKSPTAAASDTKHGFKLFVCESVCVCFLSLGQHNRIVLHLTPQDIHPHRWEQIMDVQNAYSQSN